MNGELRSMIPATQAAIEDFCWDFQQWLGPEVAPRVAFASELVLREALVNAVEHGCAGVDAGMVNCVVRGGRGRMLIAVADPGPGFDWRGEWEAEPEGDALSGRGVAIFKTYAHRVRFSRSGNVVFLMMRLDGANDGIAR